jgi:hypothetical protein
MNKKTSVIISIIVLIIVAGGAFYGGMIYGKSQNTRSSFATGNFQRTNRTGANGTSLVSGSIVSEDSSSITLQLPNNAGSKIIFYSDITQISKFATGTASDLTTGTSVSVTGTTNSDGSVTAQSIQIRPAGQIRPTSVSPGFPPTQTSAQ